ncbi:glycine betaine ABC transporter substrate-binding protein [Rhizobium giardinii]|uniref:Glycine betaine/proline transport system substrate-binding protein n=1 Tax=Rhizobium giardinii TaxID=56731 RepID=A0A7W8X9V4_9HYPH|nr:glycine betaine ABC transporter substrate-binding protein [Rhizobium giardinii]MBB5538730.1 glycine betaine/proline transport system substrate-binding protein [Rhizobium giardinii]
MKRKLALLLMSAGMVWQSVAGANAQETVRIGDSNWPSIQAMAAVIREIADKELGLKAELVDATTPVILASMERGKGDIDVHPEIWMPNHESLVKDKIANGTIKLGPVAYEVRQGICISKWMQEKYDIKSVYDLTTPEIVKLFAPNGGKPKFWIGPPGWSSTKTETVRARDYGYDQFFELSTVEENIMLVDLDKALKEEKPWISFCYRPHYLFSSDKLVMLNEPAYDPAKFKMVQPDENPNWLALSKIESAWPPVAIHIAYSTALEKRTPEFVKLITNLKVSTDEVGRWTYALAAEKQDPGAFATKWVADHKQEVDGWLFN